MRRMQCHQLHNRYRSSFLDFTEWFNTNLMSDVAIFNKRSVYEKLKTSSDFEVFKMDEIGPL